MECHELEIEIKPDGQVVVHVKGVKGAGCLDYVKILQQVMRAEGKVERTSEFYESPPNVETHLDENVKE